MEIDFNPGRIPTTEVAQPVARQSASSAAADVDSSSAATSLLDTLKNTPLSNPQQVEKARALMSDTKFPPDFVLDRIAILLATNIKR